MHLTDSARFLILGGVMGGGGWVPALSFLWNEDHCSSLEGESMARALTLFGIYPKYIVNIEVTSQ